MHAEGLRVWRWGAEAGAWGAGGGRSELLVIAAATRAEVFWGGRHMASTGGPPGWGGGWHRGAWNLAGRMRAVVLGERRVRLEVEEVAEEPG